MLESTFKKTQNGYFAKVGETSRMFFYAASSYASEQAALNAAMEWYQKEKEIQDSYQSMALAIYSKKRLQYLVELVKSDYPTQGQDYKFFIDEKDQSIGVIFGENIRVKELSCGYNIYFREEFLAYCMPVDATVEFLKSAPGSRSFNPAAPRQLHLSIANKEILAIDLIL